MADTDSKPPAHKVYTKKDFELTMKFTGNSPPPTECDSNGH